MSAAVPWYFLPQFRPARLQDCVLWLESGSFSGGIWRNLAPNYSDRNHGTAHGGVGLTPWHSQFSPVPTFYGDEYVAVPDDDCLDITGEITTEVWVKPKVSDSIFRPVVSKYQSSEDQRSWWLGCSSGSWRFYISQNGLDNKYVKASLSLNTWQHVVAIFNPATGNDLFLYANGVLKDSEDTDYSHLFSNNISVYIGEYDIGSGKNFNGTIPLVRIYKAALTPAEIRHNYTHHPLYYLQRGIDPYEVIAAATAAATPSI